MTNDEVYKLIEANGLTLHGDIEHFAALVAEREYERGFIDGMQKQMQSSVDRAVNAMSQRTWVGLTDEDELDWDGGDLKSLVKAIEARLKEKNNA